MLPEQVNAIPAKVIGSSTLKLWLVFVNTVAIPDGSSYKTFVIIPTPCCVPWTYIWSNITGVFSKTNLPSINITASLGGISASFITLISLVLPVLLEVLFWIKVTWWFIN